MGNKTIQIKDETSENLALLLSESWQRFVEAQTNIINITMELRQRQVANNSVKKKKEK